MIDKKPKSLIKNNSLLSKCYRKFIREVALAKRTRSFWQTTDLPLASIKNMERMILTSKKVENGTVTIEGGGGPDKQGRGNQV